jgi:hypothetical protein
MGIDNIKIETRQLIDDQLLKMAKINARMGLDTKTDDRIEYRRQIGQCLKEIKNLDLEFYNEICPDRKDKI